MKTTKALIRSMALASGAVLALIATPTANAVDPKAQIESGAAKTGLTGNFEQTLSNIISTVLFLVGIICVGMIIFGGVKYATSAGDPSKATSAKNTLTYAIIGLIVAASAYAIVTFVTGSIL